MRMVSKFHEGRVYVIGGELYPFLEFIKDAHTYSFIRCFAVGSAISCDDRPLTVRSACIPLRVVKV